MSVSPLRRLVRAAALSVLLLSVSAATALAGGTSTATRTAVEADCPASPPARVRPGSPSNGADPNTLTPTRTRLVESRVGERLAARRVTSRAVADLDQVTVDVRFHVITRSDGTGGVTRAQLRQQIGVLNAAYAGRTSGAAAPTPFRFRLASVDRTANDDWYDWSLADTDEQEATRALHQGGFDDLNVYVTGFQGLGYANYPWETTLVRDGIVILNESLPGGTEEGLNDGDTAVHEAGHWLGLAHTFENGCAYPGDFVADTAYQADGPGVFLCTESLDTCRARGRDPVHNFMSYGDDPCIDRFTAGQSDRMGAIWLAFRSPQALRP